MNKKSVKDFLSKNMASLAVPLIMIIIGMFFIMLPGNAIGLTVRIIGIVFVVIGLIMSGTLIAAYSSVTLAISIILIVLGIICIASAGTVAAFIIKLLGIIILVNSALRIHDAYEIKGISDKFMFYIINDIITLVLGIILIIMPISAASNIVTAVKVYLDGKYIDDGSDVVWEE